MFTLGDPTITSWQGSPDVGWGFTDANGNGVKSSMQFIRRGGRNLGSTSASTINSRVYWDNGVDVMHGITGHVGDPFTGTGGITACPTVACRMLGSDPNDNSTGQAFGLELDPADFSNIVLGGHRPGPNAYETWFHGWAMKTSASFAPQPVDAFNSIGLELHRSIESTNSHSSAGVFLLPKGSTTTGGTNSDGGLNGATWFLGTEQSVTLTTPKIGFLVNGGDYLKDVEDADNTSRFYACCDFIAGNMIKVIHQICFSPYKVTTGGNPPGFVKLWIDNGDGRGYVQYIDLSGVATIFRNGSTADGSMYPIMQHYRRTWAGAPDMTIWYGGFVRGSTQFDVTL